VRVASVYACFLQNGDALSTKRDSCDDQSPRSREFSTKSGETEASGFTFSPKYLAEITSRL